MSINNNTKYTQTNIYIHRVVGFFHGFLGFFNNYNLLNEKFFNFI